MQRQLIAGWSGTYEILLIILVVVLIFNGLLKNKVLSKINHNLDSEKKKNKKPTNSKPKKLDREYVEYDIIED